MSVDDIVVRELTDFDFEVAMDIQSWYLPSGNGDGIGDALGDHWYMFDAVGAYRNGELVGVAIGFSNKDGELKEYVGGTSQDLADAMTQYAGSDTYHVHMVIGEGRDHLVAGLADIASRSGHDSVSEVGHSFTEPMVGVEVRYVNGSLVEQPSDHLGPGMVEFHVPNKRGARDAATSALSGYMRDGFTVVSDYRDDFPGGDHVVILQHAA